MKRFVFGALLALGLTGKIVNADQLFKMDFNGDGKTDFAILSAASGVLSGNVYSSTGSAFSLSAVTSTGTNSKGQRFFFGDFNGDGKTEIGRMWNDNNSASIEISTVGATTLTTAKWATQQGAFTYDQIWLTGDFTGDGKTDLAKVYNNAGTTAIDVYAASANGTSFTNSNWVSSGGNIDGQKFVVGHFSSAARMDIAKIWNNNGNFAVTVYESNGTAFTPSSYLDAAGAFDCQWMVGDFNGDKLTDIVKYYADTTNRKFTAEVYLSGSKPMQSSVWANLQGAYNEDQEWLTGDFTGDGKDDLAKIWESHGRVSISVHASNGSGFTESAWLTEGDNYYGTQKWFSGDFDGDGKIDVARLWSDNGNLTVTVFKSTGTSFSTQAWATRSGAYVYGQKPLIPKINENGRIEGCVPASTAAAANRSALQSVLNSGGDCILCQQDVYPIDTALHYGASGQALYTEDAQNIPQYATIRAAVPANLIALWGEGRDFIRLEHVIVDGNRYRIGALDFYGGEKALMQFANGKGQKIQHNVIMSTRSWSTLQLIENRNDAYNTVRENIILGAGPDGRSNGVSTNENQTKKGHWGDAMTLGAARTHSVNNLFMDPTDVGTAIFSACGSILENNVITAMSREALGAFDMVDGISYYAIDTTVTPRTYTFANTIIRNNYFDAFGSRIHIGLGMGNRVWGNFGLKALIGPTTVINNTMAGNAFGYGFDLSGVKNFTVTGNLSVAKHTGKGNGTGPALDDPVAFSYDSNPIDIPSNNTIQPEFVKCTGPLINLLRCNAAPFIDGPNGNGNFVATLYTGTEADAIVNAAYLEILHRAPDAAEQATQTKFLLDTTRDSGNRPRNLHTADSLRRMLTQSAEFKTNFGAIANTKDAMQLYRVGVWQQALSDRISSYINQYGNYPPIKAIYQNVLSTWGGNKSIQILMPRFDAILPAGGQTPITWSSTGGIANIKVEYSTNGGSTWSVAAASAPNSGSYSWSVPSVAPTSATIRITDAAGTVSDQTTVNLIIGAVTGVEGAAGAQPKQFCFSVLGSRAVYARTIGKVNKVIIYTMQGRVVKQIPVFSDRTIWDGNNNVGNHVPAGIYSVRLVGNAATTSFKLVMVNRGR
jgi:hypothetical protein